MPNYPVDRYFHKEICKHFQQVKYCISSQHFLDVGAFTHHYIIYPGELHSWTKGSLSIRVGEIGIEICIWKDICLSVAIFDQSSIYHGLYLHIWQDISDGTYVSSRVTGDLLNSRKWNLSRYMKLDLFRSTVISLALQFYQFDRYSNIT